MWARRFEVAAMSRQPENRKQNRSKSLPKAAEPFKFRPGQSGNPGGRPKKKPITELYQEMLNDGAAIGEIRKAILKSIKDGRMAFVLQLREMADRTEGKVTQRTELSGPDGRPIETRTLSDVELIERIRQLERELGIASADGDASGTSSAAAGEGEAAEVE